MGTSTFNEDPISSEKKCSWVIIFSKYQFMGFLYKKGLSNYGKAKYKKITVSGNRSENLGRVGSRLFFHIFFSGKKIQFYAF